MIDLRKGDCLELMIPLRDKFKYLIPEIYD